jgi:hypothetical protein
MLILVCMTLFGVYLGYWLNMLTGALFYFLASVWFIKRRMKFVDLESFTDLRSNGWQNRAFSCLRANDCRRSALHETKNRPAGFASGRAVSTSFTESPT